MNFEKQYKDLFKETEEMKKENEEILNEYESTIKLLTETAEKYKEEKEAIELKYNLVSSTRKAMKDDLEGYKIKNKDKLKDIELLNKQITLLQSELSKATEVKKVYELKTVTLENDNDNFITKIREQSAIIDDLNCKLESSLEENIFLQNDLESLKQSTEEQLQRKEDFIKEMKNELLNKQNALNKALKYTFIKENSIKTKDHRDSFKIKYEIYKSRDEGYNISSIQKKESGSLKGQIIPFANRKNISEKFAELYDQSNQISEGKEYNSSHDHKTYPNQIKERKDNIFEIISFTMEIINENDNRIKEKKKEIKEGVVENIIELLSKIKERKKVITKDKSNIKAKLTTFGIKL